MALSWRRSRLLASWILGLYLARLYIEMGWVKFDPEGFFARAFVRWGYPTWLRLAVGAVEVAGGAMLITPWTATYGGLAVAAVMVGAWVTRFLDGRYADVAWISAYFVGLLWISYEWQEYGLLVRGSFHARPCSRTSSATRPS